MAGIFLAFGLLLFMHSPAQAAANYVYHNPFGTSDIPAGFNYRRGAVHDTHSIYDDEACSIAVKVEYRDWVNTAKIAYTTDGNDPGWDSNLTDLDFWGNGWDVDPPNDKVPQVWGKGGVIPAQPAGTVVKYILYSYHSGGGNWVYANGGDDGFHDSAEEADKFSYTVLDDDDTAPSITASTGIDTFHDCNFFVTVTATDAGSGISTTRSRAYFSWSATPGPSDYFDSSTATSLGGNVYGFTCSRNVAGSEFTSNIGKKIYWIVYMADADNDAGAGDADSKTASTSGAATILPLERDLVINELGRAGSSSATGGFCGGDYIEIYNRSGYSICIDSMTIQTTRGHFPPKAGINSIANGAYYLLEDYETATPAVSDSLIARLVLESNDTIRLAFGLTIIDSAQIFSTNLSNEFTANAVQVAQERRDQAGYGLTQTNWQPGAMIFAGTVQAVDTLLAGSPRAANSDYSALPIYISELMDSSAGSHDGDYFEIYNAGPDSYAMYKWSGYIGATPTPDIVTNQTCLITAGQYFLIEDNEAATSVPANYLDPVTVGAMISGGTFRTFKLFGGPDSTYQLVDQAGAADGWKAGTVGVALEKANNNMTGDGTNAANWANSSGSVGGVTGTPGETNTYVPSLPPEVAAVNIQMAAGSDSVYAGKQFQIAVKYTDVDGAADMVRFDLRIANGADTIAMYAVRPGAGAAASFDAGSGYVSSATVDSSYAGNDVTCTWTITLDWDFAKASNYKFGARAADDTPETSAWTDSTATWAYENALVLSGTLVNNQGIANGGTTNKINTSVTWSGLTVYYQGSTVSPENADFDIQLTTQSATETQTAGAALSKAMTTRATDGVDYCTATVINVPAGGSFIAATAQGMTFTLSSISYQTITVNAILSDWLAGERIPTVNTGKDSLATWIGVTWNETNLFIAWDKQEALHDSDVLAVYIDARSGGSATSVSWGGTHTLPFSADTLVYYQVRGSQTGHHNWTGAAWNPLGAIGTGAEHVLNGIVEMSVPWSSIGCAQDTFRIVAYVFNEAGGQQNIYSIVPVANRTGTPSKDLAAYLEYPRNIGSLSTNSRVYFRSKLSWRSPNPSVTSFTPQIDGVKDPGWGLSPSESSPLYRKPNPGMGDTVAIVPAGGICRDVYVTNDAQWLYIGWQAFGDPFNPDWIDPGTGGYWAEQSAHYGFLISDTSSWGSPYDPWKTSGQTRVSGYAANVWVNLYANFGLTEMVSAIRYVSDGRSWDIGTTLTKNKDFGAYLPTLGQGWGEIRVPLSAISSSLRVGDEIAIIHYGRHNGYKKGVDDMTPYDIAVASDWSETSAVMEMSETRVLVYVIKQGVITASHLPNSNPITGIRKMRTPASIKSADRANLMIEVDPAGILTSGVANYSTDAGASWNSVSVALEMSNGGAEYWYALLPAIPKDSTVRYYFSLHSDRMTSYMYGSDTYSTVGSSEATARTMPFSFTVANTVPTAPSQVTISPSVPDSSSNLIATASGAGDSDAADVLVYRFEWFKNGASQFVATDNAAPYTSTVPFESTTAGQNWQVTVSAGDGLETSSVLTSALTPISLVSAWPGTLHTEVNTGRVVTTSGVTEWIWKDKEGEERNGRTDLDLREARIKADTDYLYFLIRLGAFSVNNPHVVIAIDTSLDASGGNQIGDESQTGLDSGISTPPLRHERQIAIRAAISGSMSIELDTGAGGAGTWGAPPSGYSLNVAPTAGLIEARLGKADLQLAGACTFRVAIAVFDNFLGAAALVNSTVNLGVPDAVDAVSVASVGLNDPTRILSAWEEDLSDGDLDFWIQLQMGDTSLLANRAPDTPTGCSPFQGWSDTSNPPIFVWNVPNDPDSGDTVVAFLFELGDSGVDFDGTILHRRVVKDQFIILPTSLTESMYYTWRVRPIDRSGQIGGCTSLTFFIQKRETIIVTAPQDNQNVDNVGRINGVSVAETTIRWTWAPAVHSYGFAIDSYVIEIDTAGTFTSVSKRDTMAGSVRQYLWSGAQRGWTYYARVRAIDTGGTNGVSTASDGIYVSRRKVDGDSTEWAGYSAYGNNSANFSAAYAEGIWKDALHDERGDGKADSPSRDLVSFHVTADPQFVYFLVSTQEFADGTCLGQIAISYDGSSDNRVFQGTGTPSQDLFTATRWAWERLVRWRTGNDDCHALTPAYSAQAAKYTKNIPGKYVELCVPIELLGGAEKILGRDVTFSVATFINSSGNVGLQNGIYEPNAVDVITSEAGNTWNEVSDRCLNYAVTATFDSGGRVTAFTGTLETSAYQPQLRNDDRSPLLEERDLIMYNVFVDRFVSGRSDNPPPDPDMTGGDFQGLMDSMSYFNGMGFNCIYTSPVADFGGGAWGYNQSDLYAVQYSFADPNAKWYRLQSFIELAKRARNHNIKISIDWVPGQIYQGRTTARHPDIVDGKRFGGERVREDWSNARQFFADHSLNWAAMGAVGLRADNTKFYQPDDDPPNGMPFYRYMRKKWDEVYPGIYVYGEQPGSASDISGYVTDGMRMDGQLDFPLREQINSWVSEGQTSASFATNVGNLLATYAPKGLMAGFIENHDHSRTYHNMGGGGQNDGSKWTNIMARIRAGYMFSALHKQPPIFLYGDEVPISGWHEKVYPLASEWYLTPDAHGTQQHGQTRAMPWNFPDGTWLRDDIADYYTARNVFWQMRNGDHWFSTDHDGILVYCRGSGAGDQEKIVGYINRTGGSVGGQNIYTGDGGITYRDWISLDTYLHGQVRDIPAEGLILVKGSFGRYSVYVDCGEPNVIVSIDNNTAWTTNSGPNGFAAIHRVMTAEWLGDTVRTLTWWKPGYTVHSRDIYLPPGGGWLGNIDTTISWTTSDMTGPPAPTGLSAVSRDRAVWLRWEPVVDYPDQDPQNHVTYRVYRSTTPNNSNPEWIMETLQPWWYDSNTDDFLVNGTTYYYKIRAADRNGNLSGWSTEVACVPNKMICKFYFTSEINWDGTPSTVQIAGNHPALGTWSPITMTRLDTGLWYYETEIDPTTWPEYKYVVDGQWEWNDKFTSNDISYDRHGRPRLVTIADHNGERTAVFTNAWNTDGDVAPRKVQNALAVGAETGVYIGWSPNLEADVNRYEIQRSDNGSTYASIGYAVPNQNSFLDMTVSSETTYYYQVRAIDWWSQSGSWSDATQARVVSADTTAPRAPLAPTLYPVDTRTILLSWTPNSEGDLAGYTVYRSTDPNVPMILANRINSTLVSPTFTPSWTDSTVTAGVRYYYRLSAVDQAGNSSAGSETRSAMLVAATFELDLAVVTPSSVEISGSVYSLGPSPARVTMTQVGSTTWRKTVGLFAGEAINYLYSYNGGVSLEGAFPTSSQKREYTTPEMPAVTLSQDWDEAPRGVPAVVAYAGNKTVYLQWTADSSVDVIGYYVERAITSDSLYTRITPTALTATVYTDLNLTNGETYYYRIRSVDGGSIQLLSSPTRVVAATPEEPVWIRFRVEAAPPPRRDLLAGRTRR
jgi:glycosidase/fibronectin type 3 domain-containing protein